MSPQGSPTPAAASNREQAGQPQVKQWPLLLRTGLTQAGSSCTTLLPGWQKHPTACRPTSNVPLGGTRCLLFSSRTSFSAAQATCAALRTILAHKLRYVSLPADSKTCSHAQMLKSDAESRQGGESHTSRQADRSMVLSGGGKQDTLFADNCADVPHTTLATHLDASSASSGSRLCR